MISVVVRTKNEARWIGQCLWAIHHQAVSQVEVVLVDNQSQDGTLEVASRFPCRVVTISDQDFTFGRSLNVGIEAARGDLIAIISGHCIPLNDQWLSFLMAHFNDSQVAGVYGKQEPLPDSSPFDKRDLWLTFGMERRIQTRDPFFHNANSMLRRGLWQEVPFDEDIAGMEDRLWGRKVIDRGYHLVYEPAARVYHHHGLHHGQDVNRAQRVATVLESLQGR